MKVVVTAQGGAVTDKIDPRFGRARYFILWGESTDKAEAHDNAQNLNAAQGAGIQAAHAVERLGAGAVISGNVGPKAFRALAAAGIKVYLCSEGTVSDAIAKFKAGALKAAGEANVHGHWS